MLLTLLFAFTAVAPWEANASQNEAPHMEELYIVEVGPASINGNGIENSIQCPSEFYSDPFMNLRTPGHIRGFRSSQKLCEVVRAEFRALKRKIEEEVDEKMTWRLVTGFDRYSYLSENLKIQMVFTAPFDSDSDPEPVGIIRDGKMFLTNSD